MKNFMILSSPKNLIKKEFFVLLFTIFIILFFAASSQASFYDWSRVSPIIKDDDSNGFVLPGWNSLSAWYTGDNDYNYFRKKLEFSFSDRSNWASGYGSYIKAFGGGDSGALATPFPVRANRMNYIFSSHFIPDGVSQYLNQYSQLEWKIKTSKIWASLYFAATKHIDFTNFPVTGDINDITAVTAAPIPGTILLFGSGLLGLFGYRKRVKK